MIQDEIKASFALGGITNAMVELLEEGLVEKLIDVQDFDHPSAQSLGKTPIITRSMPICMPHR